MKSNCLIFTVLCLFLTGASLKAQNCETAFMEGYRGDKCPLSIAVSADGKHAYSANSQTVKKWDFATNKVLAEWNIPEMSSLTRNISSDGRYLQFYDKAYRLQTFDTKENKRLVIKDYNVLAIFPKQNIAVLTEYKNYKERAMLYDLATGKITANLPSTFSKMPAVSEQAGLIALWDGSNTINVVDITTGEAIFTDPKTWEGIPALSLDGAWLGYAGGIVNLKTGKKIPVKTDRDTETHFSADGKSAYLVGRGMTMDYGWKYSIAKLIKYNLEGEPVATDYSTDWFRASYTDKLQDKYTVVLHPNGNQFFVYNGKEIIVTDKEGFLKQGQKLNFFGGIGAAGMAQENAKADNAARIAGLLRNAENALNTLTVSNIQFAEGIHLSINDYDPASGLILVGTVFDMGLYSVKEKKFVSNYSRQYFRTGLTMRLNGDYGIWSLAPGGNVISKRTGNISDLYSRNTYIKSVKNAGIAKFITENLAIALNDAGKIGLYDIQQEKFLLTYASHEAGWGIEITPDRSKILLYKGESGKEVELYDVNSGKLIRKLPKYSFPAVTDKYLITSSSSAVTAVDIVSGAAVTLPGFDPARIGRNNFILQNHYISINDKGELSDYNFNTGKYAGQPVSALGSPTFTNSAYFPSLNMFFNVSTQGFAAFGVKDNPSRASAYTVNTATGEIGPVLFHNSAVQAAAKAKAAEDVKNAQTAAIRPSVTTLLANLKGFPTHWEFVYENHQRINVTSDPVFKLYYPYMGADQFFAVGKFCPSFGTTKVLGYSIKKMGSGEQFNFLLWEITDAGITRVTNIGTTQKVNGVVTELADIDVDKIGSNFNIKVVTTSKAAPRTNNYTAPAGCN